MELERDGMLKNANLTLYISEDEEEEEQIDDDLEQQIEEDPEREEKEQVLEKEDTASGASCFSGTRGNGGETGASGSSVALLNSKYNEWVITCARATRALRRAKELSDSESDNSGVTTPDLVAAFERIGN